MDQAQTLRDLMNKKKSNGIQVITVTSAKGGVGKSSIALNMAIALNKHGRRVLIVDTDFGLANIDVMLGVKTRHDLSSVIQGEVALRDIVEESPYGVKFISGGSGVQELLNLQTDQVQGILDGLYSLHEEVDTIIFDTGAGISDNIIQLICASHITWLVTTPEPTAIMDAYALIKSVSKAPTRPTIQMILNMAESEKEAQAALTGFSQIAYKYSNLTVHKLGYILRDANMVRAVKNQEPLLIGYPKSAAAANIQTIAAAFLSSPARDKTGLSGFFERFLGRKFKQPGGLQ